MRGWFSILMVAVLLVSLPGGAVAADLTSLSLNPPNVTGGTGVTGTVTVGSASQSKITIRLQSSNPAVATVPADVTVAPGAVTATFPVTTKPVGQTSTVTISGKLGGKTTAAALAVTPIVPITIAPTSVTLNPSSVAGGANVTGQVTLSGPAPAVGLAVGLASSNPTVATVPAGVTVAPGASTATFPVTTKPVIQSSTVTIAASAGGATRTAALAVLSGAVVPTSVVPTTVILSPSSVAGGANVTGQVTLSGPAPAVGLAVGLASSNPTVATVPAGVTVAPGASTATFPVTTKPVIQSSTVTIAASAGGATRTAALAVLSGAVVPTSVVPTTVILSPSSVAGGANVTGQVTLSGPAPAVGLAVGLSTSHPTVATVPAGVTVAPGASTATFPVTTKPVIENSTVTISAAAGGATRTAALAVTPIVPITIAPTSVTLNPSSVVGGATVMGQVTLSGPAPTGGLAVGLSTSNPMVAAVPAGVTVAPGASTATFPVQTRPVAQTSSVTISATAGGATRIAPLGIIGPVLTAVTLNPSSVVGGATVTGQVTLSVPAPAGGLAVDFASSSPGVATVQLNVSVAPGASTAIFRVYTRSVGQTSTVTISASYAGVTKGASLAVMPIVPTSVTLNPSSVVGGATVTGQMTLSGPAPTGGLAVGLSTSNPMVATVPGSVTVAPGVSTASFPVQTYPVGQTSIVTISATAGGATKSATITVAK